MATPNDIFKYFQTGADVEISCDDDGFRGSWFAGTVIRPPTNMKKRPSKVLVEYKTLTEDKAGKRRLREELELVQLRPLPPQENRTAFKFSDEVDAYYNDGWWEGIITEVFERDKYLVFFRCSREQIPFKASQLRIHREWVYGKWVPPLEQSPEDELTENEEVPTSSETEATNDMFIQEVPASSEIEATNDLLEDNFSPGMLVEVSSDEEGFEGAWFAATVVKELGNGKYLIEYQYLKDDGGAKLLREEVDSLHMRPCPPDVGLVDGFLVSEQVDALYNDGWWTGVVTKVLKNDRYSVYFKDTEEELKFNHSDLRVHQQWINDKWVIPVKKRAKSK